MAAARRHGAIVSYDLNYRPSLWRAIGGQERAREVNRAVAPLVDVMLGNEEDFSAALGFEVAGVDANLSALDPERFGAMMEQVARRRTRTSAWWRPRCAPSLSASRNDWSAVVLGRRRACTAPCRVPGSRSSTAWAAATRLPRG